jgi:hypothetical protein
MLTYEIMGWVALWILWGNTALVAFAAAKRAFALLGRARTLGALDGTTDGTGSLTGTIASGDGPAGELAELEVEQVGRVGAGSGTRVLFHDRAHRSKVFGGELELEGGKRVRVLPSARAEVWADEDEVRRAAECPSAATFDEAVGAARKARGFTNLVRVAFEPGRRVTVAGRLHARAGALELVAPPGAAIVVSASAPSPQLYRRAVVVLAGFIPAIFAVAGVATHLALTAPLFESPLGKLGAALGVAHFLLVLPAGTAIRDFMRLPSERFVRGAWEAPKASTQNALG